MSDIENKDYIKYQEVDGIWRFVGSTLALAYSQAHPESVSEMILRGILCFVKKNLTGFIKKEQARYFDAWESFVAIIHKKN